MRKLAIFFFIIAIILATIGYILTYISCDKKSGCVQDKKKSIPGAVLFSFGMVVVLVAGYLGSSED